VNPNPDNVEQGHASPGRVAHVRVSCSLAFRITQSRVTIILIFLSFCVGGKVDGAESRASNTEPSPSPQSIQTHWEAGIVGRETDQAPAPYFTASTNVLSTTVKITSSIHSILSYFWKKINPFYFHLYTLQSIHWNIPCS